MLPRRNPTTGMPVRCARAAIGHAATASPTSAINLRLCSGRDMRFIARPRGVLIFCGSIPHPMQSLCTLRNRCRQRPRNTRYQAGAAPYLDRTSTGWDRTSLPGDIRSPRRQVQAAAGDPIYPKRLEPDVPGRHAQ